MFIEVDRKWPAYGENNANDPLRTLTPAALSRRPCLPAA
jgi:hypothetical protein